MLKWLKVLFDRVAAVLVSLAVLIGAVFAIGDNIPRWAQVRMLSFVGISSLTKKPTDVLTVELSVTDDRTGSPTVDRCFPPSHISGKVTIVEKRWVKQYRGHYQNSDAGDQTYSYEQYEKNGTVCIKVSCTPNTNKQNGCYGTFLVRTQEFTD